MLKQIIVAVFIIYFKFHLANAYPSVYIKEVGLEDNPEDSRADLLKRTLKVIQRLRGHKNNDLSKCKLSNRDYESKLHCIIDLIERQNKPHLKKEDDFEMYPEIMINHPSRTKNFSNDYVDVKDLLRTEPEKKKKRRIVFKIVKPNEEGNDLRRFNNFVNKKILRTVSDDDSGSSDSGESRQRIQSSSGSSSSAEKIREKKKKKSNSIMYMQSPSRVYRARRRLPHFLPKRYHWNEEDLKNLRNYWFNGPQGHFWGLHKTPY